MKTNTIGVEIEFTGLTRVAAIETVAEHFGTTAYGAGGYSNRPNSRRDHQSCIIFGRLKRHINITV